ncbi:MAG: hypothetical protein KGZ63_05630 [Clostridiales bacterium]|jgi:hypothetical protein|nr:hypothetical protein [Clostridiales bacterium]
MYKWDMYCQEEDHPLLPRFFTWIAVIVYGTTFSLVLLGWVRWISLLMEYRQTLMLLAN